VYSATLPLIYQTPLELLGGHYAGGAVFPYVWLDTSASLSFANPGLPSGFRRDTANGLGDIALLPFMLGWVRGDLKSDVRLFVYAPSGDYDPAIEALSAEVSRAIQVGQQERLTVLEAVTKERVAALIELHENLIEERKALTQDVDTLVLKAVDRAMFRIAVLSGVIAIGLCAWTVVLLFLGRRLFRGEGRSSLLAESAPPTMPA
ncbi:MAG: transporter, partial [Verrucomicrobiae bacterium]|nr:transporter [Verrucomicrobiae bacterium]